MCVDRGRPGSGAGLADGSRLASICRSHFTNQMAKFWGIQPSYAFVAEPQTSTASPSGSIAR